MEKVITGYWDGLQIWRYKTAAEKLIEELQKEQVKKSEVEEETV